jgi:hypothetical protein
VNFLNVTIAKTMAWAVPGNHKPVFVEALALQEGEVHQMVVVLSDVFYINICGAGKNIKTPQTHRKRALLWNQSSAKTGFWLLVEAQPLASLCSYTAR